MDTNADKTSNRTTADAWPRPGSTFYYALQGYPSHVHTRTHAVLQLIETVSECLLDVTETTVAETKIHWWHEEIDRLHKSEPRHPVTIKFTEILSDLRPRQKALVRDCLLKLLSLGSGERFNNIASEQDMLDQLHTEFSTRWLLIALALDEPVEQQHLNALGDQSGSADNPLTTGLGLTHKLIRFHRYYFAGMAVWPDNLYQQYGLQPESLSREHPSVAQTQLQTHIIDKASEHLRAAIERLQKSQTIDSATVSPDSNTVLPALKSSDSVRCISVYTAIRLAQLKHWRKHNTNLLDQYSTLTPLRKYWITWQTGRRIGP